MSNMRDYDLDVVMAKVGYHLHGFTDGRLAKLASLMPEGSDERSLLENLVGSLRIVDDSARVALAQESLRVKEEDPDNRDENIMQEVMFNLLANSDLDSHSRGIMYRILHWALFGTEPGTVPENEEASPGDPIWPEVTDAEAEDFIRALAEDAAEDKWLRMIAEENENDGLEQGEQPLVLDDDGVIRFRENRLIRLLLEAGPFDLNQIALMAFSDQERQQLAQLIGYSVSGYGDLSYAEGDPTARADRAVDIFIAEQESGGE